MYRQVGDPVIKNGLMKNGVLIRHLVMPNLTKDSIAVLSWIKDNIPNVLINLMDQYRPEYRAGEYDAINRRVTSSEFKQVDACFRELDLRMDSNFLDDLR